MFKGREGWFSSREFVGDKEELAQAGGHESCTASWTAISRVFQNVKTLTEFQRAISWATHLYQSDIPKGHEQEPVLPSDMPLMAARALEKDPDEVLIVYEDLGSTGIKTFLRCPNCGRAYPVAFKLDGTLDASFYTCLSCGTPLDWAEPVPSNETWLRALETYRTPPATYKVHSGTVLDQVAREHAGKPLKILKIVCFEAEECVFEAQFRDWKTALVRASELELVNANTSAPQQGQAS